MRPINKFILHVVHNLIPLNEYSEGEVKRLITRFKDEADDLNIEISEDDLKSYIEQFDRLKQNLPDREIRNYSLSKLIRLATTSKGAKSTKQQELTPDVVYHNEDNSIVIYNGSIEDNCIKFGKGEKWCITRGSYAKYRYDSERGYPTFYLAKNSNLPTSDPLSFVAIQVRDLQYSERYVWTNRENWPLESTPKSFPELVSDIPWLRSIPNLHNILNYIPLTTKEKLVQQYSKEPVSVKIWEKFPYETKEQYLTVRSPKDEFFSDISNETFIQKYLPKYPQIAYYIAITPGLIKPITLLSNLEYFSNQDRKSITANLQQSIDIKYLKLEKLPFNVKKLLIKLNKFDVKNDEKFFISKDGSTIVGIHFTSPVELDIYQEDDYYLNLNLNKRTIGYLKNLDINDISQLPFNILIELSSEGILTKEVVTNVINNAKTDKNSPIVVKEKEGEEILLDSNTLSSYKVKEQDISQIPFKNEKVQQIFDEEINNNESFQNNVLNIFKNIFKKEISEDILERIDNKENLFKIINKIPYNKRIIQSTPPKIILADTDSTVIFSAPSTIEDFTLDEDVLYLDRDLNLIDLRIVRKENLLRSYFKYLKAMSFSFNDEKLLEIYRSWAEGTIKRLFVLASPPLNPNNTLVPYVQGDRVFLINIAEPNNSYKIGRGARGRFSPYNAPASMVQQASALLRGQPHVAIARRRGRPARIPGTAPVQAVPAPQGDVNIAEAMEEVGLLAGYESLPTAIKNRITTGNRVSLLSNRGAARRNNLLAGRGRIIRAIDSGASSVYIIRLNNNTTLAAAAIYPGNNHYIITADTSFSLNTPNDLLNALTQRNLLESLKGIIAGIYLLENPHRTAETKIILEHYLNLKHPNQSVMKTSELKRMISSVIAEVLAENKKVKNLKKESKSADLAKKIAQRYNNIK